MTMTFVSRMDEHLPKDRIFYGCIYPCKSESKINGPE